MKKLAILLILGLIITPIIVKAQGDDKKKDEVKRPTNVGISNFDNFKNSSFDITDESSSLKKNVAIIDKEIKSYSGLMNTIGVDKLKKNFKALKESQVAIKKLTDRIGKLDNEGKILVQDAKNVKPKLKSVSATKNTNKSIKGLGVAKGEIKSVTALLNTDIKLISDELKSRGELIE